MAERTHSPPQPDLRGAGQRRRERLSAARLYLVVEARPGGRPAAEVLEPALAGGVDLVQLREKHGGGELVLDAARTFRDLCDAHGALFIVNDDPSLALRCDADGLHLGQGDAPIEEARALLGADAVLGVSTHSAGEIAAAERSSADYLAVGPVYETPTKPGVVPVGEELVRHAAERVSKPFFAIGGIDVDNASAVAAAGARRLAAVRAIRDAADPEAAARGLRCALEREAGP